MNIGAIEVDSVIDGVGRAVLEFAWKNPAVDGQDPKGALESDWEGHRDLISPDGLMEIPAGGFLVRSGDRIALIDTGKGELHEDPPNDGPWPGKFFWNTGALIEQLALLGVNPSDVTDVLFSHLHSDHTGWASKNGQATFPKATYRCDVRDWEYFFPNGEAIQPRLQPLLAPIENQMTCWDSDGPILPGIDALRTPGHTPGSTVFVISSGNERAVVLGDAVHCPIQLVDDEWAAMGDIDKAMARRARESLARELGDGQTLMAGPHFPGMKFGRLLSTELPRQWSIQN